MTKEQFNDILIKSLDQLCEELLDIKHSYFTSKGKPDWKPLTDYTIQKKKKVSPNHVYDFNTRTTYLRDSLHIDYKAIPGGIRIYSWAADDPALVAYLTKKLGRDFLIIDSIEQKFIQKRLTELLEQNAKA